MRRFAYFVIGLNFLVFAPAYAQELNIAKRYCDPDPYQIAIWDAASYFGDCVVLGRGDYPSDKYIAPRVRFRGLSSILIGASAKALLCSGKNFGGRCETFTADAARLSEHTIGDNNVGSIRVVGRDEPERESTCTPGAGEIVLFGDSNFRKACVVLGPGEYPDWIAIGLVNDSISSIKVGDAVVAILCAASDGLSGPYIIDITNDQFPGCIRFYADTADLG
jgi:hypothetical protein